MRAGPAGGASRGRRTPLSSGLLLLLATFFVLVALGCQNVTVVGGDYRFVLSVASVGMVLADVCCFVVFRRGGVLRAAAVVLALPSLFIVLDTLRRVAGVVLW